MSGLVVRNGAVAEDAHVFEFGEQFAPSERAPDLVSQPAPVNAKPAKPVVLQPMSTTQLLRDLKQRLRFVEGEIKARKALEKERDQIRRLIQAAKKEKATVHAIKRAAG